MIRVSAEKEMFKICYIHLKHGMFGFAELYELLKRFELESLEMAQYMPCFN